MTNIYALFCLVSSYFVYKYILKDIYHHFKNKGIVQETCCEASYVVPSTQYDRIEGPKFRRRNIKSTASGTGTARDADSRKKHSFKHCDTKEQVPLPFPAGRNTYQIMSARPSKLPTVASSVLVESSVPLPIGCQRKIPELPYDFFGDSAEKVFHQRRAKTKLSPCLLQRNRAELALQSSAGKCRTYLTHRYHRPCESHFRHLYLPSSLLLAVHQYIYR